MKGYKHTKYGTVSINDYGYYRITSTREGNYGKYLHRLIFEDFYGPIPKGCTVHHKDENKLNNCIMNLQILPKAKHSSLHNAGEGNGMYGKGGELHPAYGSKHKIERKLKSSDSHIGRCNALNKTGYYRVHKCKDKDCKQGFTWVYRVELMQPNGKKFIKTIRRVNLKDLEEEVKRQGFEWKEL